MKEFLVAKLSISLCILVVGCAETISESMPKSAIPSSSVSSISEPSNTTAYPTSDSAFLEKMAELDQQIADIEKQKEQVENSINSITQNAATENLDGVTLEQYNQLEKGMTYDEVVAILGTEDEKISDEYSSWKGRGTKGANIMISFDENHCVVTFAQVGLQ